MKTGPGNGRLSRAAAVKGQIPRAARATAGSRGRLSRDARVAAPGGRQHSGTCDSPMRPPLAGRDVHGRSGPQNREVRPPAARPAFSMLVVADQRSAQPRE